MRDVPKLFGSMVFNDETMQARLPEDVYLALKKSMAQGTHLELDVANAVANAMKEWAIEKGATHFTHWFQPMTGITAEKHDSFISLVGSSKVIMEFSGKELVRGERTLPAFLREDCAPPSKRGAIPFGILLRTLLSEKGPCTSLQLSAPTAVRL